MPSEPDNLFGNVARILRRMTHFVHHVSLHVLILLAILN